MTSRLAEALWPGQSPIGRSFSIGGPAMRVVGVTSSLAYGSLRFSAPAWFESDRFDNPKDSRLFLTIHSDKPAELVGPVGALIAARFPDAVRVDVATGRQVIARDLGRERLGALFFSGFGLVALALGVGGVFGLVAYLAEARRRELGIRMALGASPTRLMREAVAAALAPVGLGAALGLIGATALAKGLQSLLLGVTPLDLLTYFSTAVLMITVACLAAFSAALRIRRVSPLEASRG